MSEIKVRKTIKTTVTTTLDLIEAELNAILTEKFDLPAGSKFHWRIDRYEEFDGVEITHESVEEHDED